LNFNALALQRVAYNGAFVFPNEDELVALEAIASSLSKLVTLEGCTELIAPITEPTTVEDLCKARERE
jgi:hypothetical protein